MNVRKLSVQELTEGAWRRALRDTRVLIFTLPFTLAWVLTSAVAAVAVVVLGASLASLFLKSVLAGAAIVGGFVAAVALSFIVALSRAPFRQRDDARLALAERGGPRISVVHQPDWSTSMLAGRRHQYVTVACGIAKPRKGGWPLDPDRARAFAEASFPATFPRYPSEYGSDLVSFEVQGDGGLDDPWRRMMRFHSGGLVELTWRLPDPQVAEGIPVPSLLEICRPIYRLAETVRRGAYARLYPTVYPRHKIVWMTGINIQTLNETGSVITNDLVFPGASPGGRARRGYLAMNGDHYYAGVATEPADLLRTILNDQLSRSGWMDCHTAIEDTLRAVAAAESPLELSSVAAEH